MLLGRKTVMNEQDCSAVYDELVEILNELELSWVAEQVDDIVSAGKTVEEMVAGRKSPDLKLAYHGPRERLLLLLDAVDRALISGAEMDREIADILGHEALTAELKPEIRFASAVGGKGKVLKFSPDPISARSLQCDRLKLLLAQLRSEVEENGS